MAGQLCRFCLTEDGAPCTPGCPSQDIIEREAVRGEFYLDRREDESGVSGTGIVARGFEFPDGQCILWWRGSGCLGVYPNRAKLVEIHGHQGKTLLVDVQ